MSAYLDERYFEWLYGQVCSVRVKNPVRSYRNLLHCMYTKEFVWLVPNDDNRVEDGRDLRWEFYDQEGVDISHQDDRWFDLGCSFLEMLVALCRRWEFESEKSVRSCFKEILRNLDLDGMNDSVDISIEDVDDVIDRVVWRTYNYDGSGGLFPLEHPDEDQRKTEIWYQLSAYILERS